MNQATCVDRGTLEAFALGNLPDPDAETIAAHLDQCPTCEAIIASLDGAADSFLAELRRSEGAAFAAEDQCRAALLRACAIGSPGVATAVSVDQELPIPQLGEYELLEKLGEGGMGAVYKARHTRLKRIVAIKVLPPEKTGDPRAIARFEREMEAVGQLAHPNIVQAHDAREIDGTFLLVMEYVEGMDLGKLSRRLGPLPIADACEVVRQAALGLQYAHEHGLVHRDIKPSNLMLHCSRHTPSAVQPASPATPFQTPNDAQPTTPGGTDGTRRVPATLDADGTRRVPATLCGAGTSVKILDLGLALLAEERRDAAVEAELTAAGHPMGTADYIAPEQADDAHSVDIRADIYSLGCTLYKLLTGQAPFAGPRYKSDFDKMMAHCRDPITPVRELRADVPEELEAILGRMLAKDPAERFAAPGALEAAFAPLADKADLAALLARAERQTDSARLAPQRSRTTMSHASSALQGTDPVGLPRAGEAAAEAGATTLAYSPAPRSSRWRRVPRWAIAAGLLPVVLFFGIILLINRTRIEVPDGSEVLVARDGTVTVTLPDGSVQITRPEDAASPEPVAPSEEPEEEAALPLPGRIVLAAEPLEIASGEPLSRNALVLQPAPIEGVLSWTVETIAHRGSNPVAAFSPDGQTVATVCSDPTIRFWNAADGKFLRAIVAHEGSISGLAWCPDGRLLATASADRTVRIWDVASGRRLATFPGKSAFSSIDWSSDPRYLAAGCRDGTVHFWEFMLATDDPAARTRREGWRPAITGVRTREAEHPDSYGVRVVRWSPDGKTLAVGGGGLLRLWDGQAGTPIPSIKFKGPHGGSFGGGLWSLAWSPDGSQVVTSASAPAAVSFWNAVTGELISTSTRPDHFLPNRVAWSPDGKRVTAADWYGPLRSFEVESGKVLVQQQYQGVRYGSLDYSPDGRLLAAARTMGRVELCDPDTLKPLHVLPAHTAGVALAAWSPDGNAISTASAPGSGYLPDAGVRLVQMASAETLWETPVVWEDVFHLTWSADGKRLAARWHMFDGMTGRQVFELRKVMAECSRVASSPTEAVLATYCPPGSTRLDVTRFIDMSTGELLREFPGYGEALTWSPDGKSVALGLKTDITLRDAHTGDVAATLAAPTGNVRVMAWSPDRRLLAAGMDNGKVHVFDVDSGALLRTGEGHTSTVVSLAWLDEGFKLASGTSTEVCVWDASGELLRTIPDNGGTFSPDGRLVASRGASSLRLWDLDDGRYLRTLLTLRDRQYAAITPEGHFSGSADVQLEFVYIVQTDEGQQTLTPAEFSERYGWKNDPAKVDTAQDPPAGTAETDGP